MYKNITMSKPKSTEEKISFINANRSCIPTKQIDYFNSLDTDKQYKKMVIYVRKSGNSTSPRFNVKSAVKAITGKNPTPAQVKKVIDELNEWMNSTKKRELEEIERQIAELIKKKEQLNK